MSAGIALKKGIKISRYIVQELLNEERGGMARVVRATPEGRTPNPTDDVALKISRTGTDPFFETALRAETEILRKLQHRGVVKIIPMTRDRGVSFMAKAIELEGAPWFCVLEFLAGGSLKAYLKTVGKLSLPEAAAIAGRMAQAVQHVHAQGYAHNDLKPENVIFRRPLRIHDEFDPVLVDFGIAAKINRVRHDAITLKFTSPERLDVVEGRVAPESVADPSKADIWSLGVILYNMLAGRPPFEGGNDRQVTTAIRRERPISLHDYNAQLPPDVNEFVLDQCLNKQPRHRPNAKEMRQFCEAYNAQGVVQREKKKGWFGF